MAEYHGRKEKINWGEYIGQFYSCQPIPEWISFIATSQLMFYLSTGAAVSSAMILSTAPRLPWGGLADSSAHLAPYLFIPAAMSQPIFPAILMRRILLNLAPQIKWTKMYKNDQGQFGLFIWMEIIVITSFALPPLLLQHGVKERKSKYLNIWILIGMASLGMVIIETIILFSFGIYFHPYQIGTRQFLFGFFRIVLTALAFLFPLGAVQIFKREIWQEAEDERILELSGDICL